MQFNFLKRYSSFGLQNGNENHQMHYGPTRCPFDRQHVTRHPYLDERLDLAFTRWSMSWFLPVAEKMTKPLSASRNSTKVLSL